MFARCHPVVREEHGLHGGCIGHAYKDQVCVVNRPRGGRGRLRTLEDQRGDLFGRAVPYLHPKLRRQKPLTIGAPMVPAPMKAMVSTALLAIDDVSRQLTAP